MTDMPPSELVLTLFRRRIPTVTDTVVSRIVEGNDDLSASGEREIEILPAGIKMTLEMLYNAMSVGEPSILDEQLEWAALRLPVDGVTPKQILARFRIIREVILEEFQPEQSREIVSYVDWMIEKQKNLLHPGESRE